MSSLDETVSLASKLSKQEQLRLLDQLSRSLGFVSPGVFPGIERQPGVCGGSACIVRTRIPVWALELQRSMGLMDAQLLSAYPSLRADDLVTAWAYVAWHCDEIERDICTNQAA